jgi:hypothetical protein
LAEYSSITDTHQKALAINLDTGRYGVFAEVGAGQEVSRWFFHVGGAAGTVAKSVSAYDMQVSDRAYGKTSRYVSRERLIAMLEHEQAESQSTLDDVRGEETAFFVFAETVAAASYTGPQECHGWLGVRFQTAPRSPYSQILLHVRMLDGSNLQQQEALGIVGVNLIYGAFEYHEAPERLVPSLLDSLSARRIEVDMIQFSGAAFSTVDNRVMSLQLVEQGLTPTALFDTSGRVLQASEVLHKRPVLIQPGRFRPPTLVSADIQASALARFRALENIDDDPVVSMMGMNLTDLAVDGSIDLSDYTDRIDVLAAGGDFMVLISNHQEYFRIAQYVARYTTAPIGIALGVSNLFWIFDESRYDDLEGGLLEGLGRLFKRQVRLLVYPELSSDGSGAVVTAADVTLPSYDAVYHYLLDTHRIEPIIDYNRESLHIRMDDVSQRIGRGDPTWRTMVPVEVARIIEEKQLFGFQTAL